MLPKLPESRPGIGKIPGKSDPVNHRKRNDRVNKTENPGHPQKHIGNKTDTEKQNKKKDHRNNQYRYTHKPLRIPVVHQVY